MFFKGLRGDNFMRMIEPLSASVPYHVCPGNHENAYNFSQYVHRYMNNFNNFFFYFFLKYIFQKKIIIID